MDINNIITKVIMVSPNGDTSGLVELFGTSYYMSTNEVAGLLGNALLNSKTLLEAADILDEYKANGAIREIPASDHVDFTHDLSEMAEEASLFLFSA